MWSNLQRRVNSCIFLQLVILRWLTARVNSQYMGYGLSPYIGQPVSSYAAVGSAQGSSQTTTRLPARIVARRILPGGRLEVEVPFEDTYLKDNKRVAFVTPYPCVQQVGMSQFRAPCMPKVKIATGGPYPLQTSPTRSPNSYNPYSSPTPYNPYQNTASATPSNTYQTESTTRNPYQSQASASVLNPYQSQPSTTPTYSYQTPAAVINPYQTTASILNPYQTTASSLRNPGYPLPTATPFNPYQTSTTPYNPYLSGSTVLNPYASMSASATLQPSNPSASNIYNNPYGG